MSTTASPTGKKNVRSESAQERPFVVIEECDYFAAPPEEERADRDRMVEHVERLSRSGVADADARFAMCVIPCDPIKRTFPTTLKT